MIGLVQDCFYERRSCDIYRSLGTAGLGTYVRVGFPGTVGVQEALSVAHEVVDSILFCWPEINKKK